MIAGLGPLSVTVRPYSQTSSPQGIAREAGAADAPRAGGQGSGGASELRRQILIPLSSQPCQPAIFGWQFQRCCTNEGINWSGTSKQQSRGVGSARNQYNREPNQCCRSCTMTICRSGIVPCAPTPVLKVSHRAAAPGGSKR